jgi:putative transposase
VPSRSVRPVAGFVYHVTSRCCDGVTLFDSSIAYGRFLELIAETQAVRPIRLLAFCLMPNHLHLVLWPETDDAVERFVGWLLLTHAKRFNAFHDRCGPLYPKRYEAVSVQAGRNLYRVIRYVERNPCAARLARTPDDWRWSSAAPTSPIRLSEWPVPRPPDWKDFVRAEIESGELEQIRRHLKRGPLRRLRRSKRDDFAAE